jgi:hypothetical protein
MAINKIKEWIKNNTVIRYTNGRFPKPCIDSESVESELVPLVQEQERQRIIDAFMNSNKVEFDTMEIQHIIESL